MNIENLKKELEQTNTFTYKRLCEILEEKTKGGNGKNQQLEDWFRYFDYKKEDRKIKVLSIRDKVLPNIDNMLGRSKYYEDLETIILYALKEEGGSLKVSMSKALSFTNLVNQNYFVLNGNERAVSKFYDVDLDFLYAFKNLSSTKLRGIFKRTLNTMKNKALILYNEITMVCEEQFEVNIVDGKEVCESKKVFRPSTREDDRLIVKIENKALKDLGFTDKKSCYVKGKWREYMELISEGLSQESNILFYYTSYVINSNEEVVLRTISERENENAKASLNGNISNSFVTSNDKSIANDKLRKYLVHMLIEKETSIDLFGKFIDVKNKYETAKENYEMINYENLM